MNRIRFNQIDRRQFIRRTGAAAGLGLGRHVFALGKADSVAIISETGDSVASSPPGRWAAGKLQESLTARGIGVRMLESLEEAGPGTLCILAAGAETSRARELLGKAALSVPSDPESLGIVPGRVGERPVLLACGRDATGLVYALLELADRAEFSPDPIEAFMDAPAVEKPANRIRCMSRAFCSDVEDKGWYNDREMWPEYLTMLATQRFNRFNLTLGLAYDFNRNVTDCYFHFAYPFLVSVPGYDVRAVGLPDEERDRNFEMLRHMSDQAAMRGLQFNLGVWTHAYIWTESPNANYTISGLTPETHGPYCRDALKMILQACPGITGVTIRIHGESGVPEGSYEFWRTVFNGVVQAGRTIEIDLHAKGIDQEMIDIALDTGLPVVLAPKYWAEHMGLPYHQAAIRELERRPREGEGFFSISGGARRFTRYGYADLLKEDRAYGVVYRMFPGARRALLWGDPVTAAGYGRVSSFCGSDGVDFMEPLYFKGRRGSGVPGDRCSYQDVSLRTRWDWQKFLYTYRVWGRHLYNPEASPDTWRRYLDESFGNAAAASEKALGKATRLLQIVCTAHGVSAAHNRYWPEMYTNMSIVDTEAYNPYRDTPEPRLFGNVSPFDPELFLTIEETAGELLSGKRSGKYTQIEAAQWLEDLAGEAAGYLEEASRRRRKHDSPKFRRLAIDTAIQIGLGQFFASKVRSAVLWGIYTRTGDRNALGEAVHAYRNAGEAWAKLADMARGVYMSNVSYGPEEYLHGHWLDRIPAIQEDIDRMARELETPQYAPAASEIDSGRLNQAVSEATGRPERVSIPCEHTVPQRFQPGQALPIELNLRESIPGESIRVWLHYRHVNQAELYEKKEMECTGSTCRTEIPAEYTRSDYPLQYYFELRTGDEEAWLFPGFEADLSNQPYFVCRQV